MSFSYPENKYLHYLTFLLHSGWTIFFSLLEKCHLRLNNGQTQSNLSRKGKQLHFHSESPKFQHEKVRKRVKYFLDDSFASLHLEKYSFCFCVMNREEHGIGMMASVFLSTVLWFEAK